MTISNNKILGYMYVIGGSFLAIYLAGQLLFQLLGAFVGLLMVFHGLKLLAMHRTFSFYSSNFFGDRFRR